MSGRSMTWLRFHHRPVSLSTTGQETRRRTAQEEPTARDEEYQHVQRRKTIHFDVEKRVRNPWRVLHLALQGFAIRGGMKQYHVANAPHDSGSFEQDQSTHQGRKHVGPTVLLDADDPRYPGADRADEHTREQLGVDAAAFGGQSWQAGFKIV